MKKTMMTMAMALWMGGLSVSAQAQDNKQKAEKPSPEKMVEMRAQKIASDLTLDDATTEKFVAVYKEYSSEMWQVMSKNKPQMKAKAPKPEAKEKAQRPERKEMKAKTDAEVEKEFFAQVEAQKKMAEVKEKYYEKFRKFLNAKQTVKALQEGGQGRGPQAGPMGRNFGKQKNQRGPQAGNQRFQHHGKHHAAPGAACEQACENEKCDKDCEKKANDKN